MSSETDLVGNDDNIWEFLHDCLAEGLTAVLFEKADGTMREMVCTTNPEFINYEFKKTDTEEKEPVPVLEQTHFTVWDYEAKGWRKLTKGKIVEVSLFTESEGDIDDE